MGIVDHQVAFLHLKHTAVQTKDCNFLCFNIFKFNVIFVFLSFSTTTGSRWCKPGEERVYWRSNLIKDRSTNSSNSLNASLHHGGIAGSATVSGVII